MLFGESVFQSVLNRLRDEQLDEAGDDDQPTSHRIRGLSTGFVADMLEGVSVGSWRMDQPYYDLAMEPDRAETPEPAEPLVMPAHLARTAPEDVARELALSTGDTIQSLGEKRRHFAKANHPDGVAPPFRDNATMRMMIANLLIDEAIRRLSR